MDGQDVIAREAYYHSSCYNNIILRNIDDNIQDSNKSDTKIAQEAHSSAFSFLCAYIQDSIIDKSNVERMTMLKERYLNHIFENYPTVHNPLYKTEKLKRKIQTYFNDKLEFWSPNNRHTSDLVYSNCVNKGSAIETAFEIGASEQRQIEEAAMILRRHIWEEYRMSDEMPWSPPRGSELSSWREPPKCLSNFLAVLISGKNLIANSAWCLRWDKT